MLDDYNMSNEPPNDYSPHSAARIMGVFSHRTAEKRNECSDLDLVETDLLQVHESFRNENILFFPPHDGSEGSSKTRPGLDLSEPWVLGFDFSRPESYFSYGIEDTCTSRDIYRHPDRQQSPSQPFNKLHDIYALGVVLLEIGLWQPAITLEKDQFRRLKDPASIRKCLSLQAQKRLGSRTGEKYKDIVLKCLHGDFNVVNDTKEDSKLQREFRIQVVDVLERAADSI